MKGGSHRPTAFSYINLNEDNGETNGYCGGIVMTLKATAALLVGDLVFFDGTVDQVDKSATAADYVVTAGIVVGGESTEMAAIQDDEAIGVMEAAGIGEKVLVCVWGVAKAIAQSAITIHSKIGPGATDAGKVDENVTAGQQSGIAMDAATLDGDIVRVFIGAPSL